VLEALSQYAKWKGDSSRFLVLISNLVGDTPLEMKVLCYLYIYRISYLHRMRDHDAIAD
jgi:hypothetical protein